MKSMYYSNLSPAELIKLKDDYKKVFARYLPDTTDKVGNVVRQMESQWADCL